MNSLSDMIWVEWRKAIRSKMPWWTGLGALFLPCGIAFLIFVSKNPQISQKLGLVSAKANLVAYAAADWATYLGLFGQFIAAGGFILFVLIITWVFGREFADGTLKDMLAVPVERASILAAKYLVVAAWCAALTLVILLAGLALGAAIRLPGGSPTVIALGSARVVITALLTIVIVLPLAFFASVGRGYLLPVGMAVLILMITNIAAIVGWGDYFPFAVAGLFAVAKPEPGAVSYWIAFLTSAAGMLATYAWWKYADQSR